MIFIPYMPSSSLILCQEVALELWWSSSCDTTASAPRRSRMNTGFSDVQLEQNEVRRKCLPPPRSAPALGVWVSCRTKPQLGGKTGHGICRPRGSSFRKEPCSPAVAWRASPGSLGGRKGCEPRPDRPTPKCKVQAARQDIFTQMTAIWGRSPAWGRSCGMWVAKPLLCCQGRKEIPWICLSSQTRTCCLKQSQTAAGTAGPGTRRESSIIQQKSPEPAADLGSSQGSGCCPSIK